MRSLLAALVLTLTPLAAQAQPATVVLVRHGEKAPAPADNPPLSSEGEARAHARATAAAVRARPAGEVVLVVGHSNTLPSIIAALGGPPMPELCDQEYATLFVLELRTDGPARLVRASFGDPDTAADTACNSMRP